ncbi:hypothetical protein M1C57_24185 (plasmid) [Rhodococcus pyridinivorans]|uniref:hypothetical protein n=1 Tax=Rhodococcus pyridinivorans TaxID=103816 RepID=UPI00200A803A|nr:hypothetical protein [Rhodococcus pyridinivorans]UPW06988.1 hypothetical protein M1C57_24185 [Rhodococcus pyridinivorans]
MTPTLSLDHIDYPEGDPYRDPAVHRAGERFWWHQAIAYELRRLRDECTNPCRRGASHSGVSADEVKARTGSKLVGRFL